MSVASPEWTPAFSTCSLTAMHTTWGEGGRLSRCTHLPIRSYSIHIYLLGLKDELGDDHRVVLVEGTRLREVGLKVLGEG